MSQESLTVQQLKDLITKWKNRVAMANHQGNEYLEEQAQIYVDRYGEMLSDLYQIEIDDDVDYEPLHDDDDGPYNPSGVPRNPKPYSGTGAIALPLPEIEEEESTET